MEVFVDFGLFELLALTGLAALGRLVFRRRVTRVAWLALSIVAPLFLVFWSPNEAGRWMATVALTTTLVNVAVLLRVYADQVPTSATAVRHAVPADVADKGVA